MTVTDEDRKAGRITDADIEAIADSDPVWAVADRIVFENHGVGNAAVIIKRYAEAAYVAGLERAAVIAEKMRDRCDPEMSHPEAIRYDEANAIATAILAEKDKT